MYRQTLYSIFIVLTLSRCASTHGFVSAHNPQYFQESPSVVFRDNCYFLRFRYAYTEQSFFMMTSSKMTGDKLIFYLSATASSGNLAGKLQFEKITTAQKIELINSGSVYWEEPDRSLLPIKVATMAETFHELKMATSGRVH